ncbi:hypothetical protein Tco_0736313 [Tanacetum coccineum]
MEAHLAPKQHVQVNKISFSCKICSGPHDNQFCMENPEQAFVEYASPCIDEAGGVLPSDTVKNPKLDVNSTSPVLSARGTDCLPTATIFEELARMGYEKPSPKLTFYKAFFSPQWKFSCFNYLTHCLVLKTTASWNGMQYDTMGLCNHYLGEMSHHKKTYVNPSHTKKIFANMKREGKDFSGRVTPLFAIMMVQANQEEGVDLDFLLLLNRHPLLFNHLHLNPRRNSLGGSRKSTAVPHPSDSTADVPNEESVPTHSNDPLLNAQEDEACVSTPSYDPSQSGEDRMQLHELMNLCTKLSDRVLALETTKSNQALEIESLKRRVKSLEKRKKSRTSGFKRLRKGRKIADLDADAEVTLVDETQEMNDDNLMFDTGVLEEQEKDVAEKEVSAADPVTTAGEVVTTANVEVTTVNAPTTTIDELTLAQTLIEIKAAKPKAVTSAATTTTTTRPKARGVVVQEPSEFKTTSSSLQASQLPQAKDKGKGIMVEPEVPLKKKDQVALDEEMARNLEAQLQAELIEEERLARQKEEEANIALLESWDNTQAMMDADFQLAQQMQTEEQEQLSIEEKSKLFVELLEKRKKHFAALRAQEKRSKPPTKAQKRNQMSTYLKNMAGYKHGQLKSKSYDEIQEMFDKEMKRLESDNSKKQKIDEHVEAEKDDDQEEAEMKRHIEIVKDDEVAIDAIHVAIKPPVIVDYKIVKEGQKGFYNLIRAYGSSKRYSSMIKMLQNIDREDLETLWKLVKAKHGNTRPGDDYERVFQDTIVPTKCHALVNETNMGDRKSFKDPLLYTIRRDPLYQRLAHHLIDVQTFLELFLYIAGIAKRWTGSPLEHLLLNQFMKNIADSIDPNTEEEQILVVVLSSISDRVRSRKGQEVDHAPNKAVERARTVLQRLFRSLIIRRICMVVQFSPLQCPANKVDNFLALLEGLLVCEAFKYLEEWKGLVRILQQKSA